MTDAELVERIARRIVDLENEHYRSDYTLAREQYIARAVLPLVKAAMDMPYHDELCMAPVRPCNCASAELHNALRPWIGEEK